MARHDESNDPIGERGLLVALAVLGIAMYALMAWIEQRTTGWAHRSGFAAA